jgi:zinc transporter
MSPVLFTIAFGKDGVGRPAPTTDGPGAAPADGFVWIHVDAAAPGAEAYLRRTLDLDPVAADVLLAEESRPRCTTFGDAASVNLRGVNHNPGEEAEDMVSLRMWVTPSRLVTAYYRPVLAVADVRTAFEEGHALAATPGALIALIALRLADLMTPTIAELNDALDAIEEQVAEDAKSISRAKLSQQRRSAIMFRRFVAPQREALNRLSLEIMPWATDADRRRFREAADMTTRLAEELDAVRERAAIVHDQIIDARSVSLNRSMLVLSVATVVFLPLNLVAGLFGMNVAGVPLAQSPWGFWIVSGSLVALGGVGGWVFKRIGWL